MITIVDYGLGNIGSLFNMIKKICPYVSIASDLNFIRNSNKIILPGVGAFDAAMKKINSNTGLKDVLDELVLTRSVPVLGICLGMQIMMQNSEEGWLPGLGWVPGRVLRFPRIDNLKVPHMGWNAVRTIRNCELTKEVDENFKFYFVHSYYASVSNQTHSIMKTHHGIEFDSVVCKDNIFGVQFHPEKSHRYGLAILKNFVKI